MTVLYFSSTGNSLYIAKRIGGKLLSIPGCIHKEIFDIEDTEVGIVFPVYGLCVPPFIMDFIKNASIRTSYLFAVATYGFFPGAVCGQLSGLMTKKKCPSRYIRLLPSGFFPLSSFMKGPPASAADRISTIMVNPYPL